jgi:hypothetical protein
MSIQSRKYPSVKRVSWSPDLRASHELGGNLRDETHYNFISENSGISYVATIKYDGGNIFMDNQTIHARSVDDNCSHAVYSNVKRLWNEIKYNIPDNMAIFGEDLYVTRSIQYTNLPNFFIVFAVIEYVDGQWFVLSIDEQKTWCELLDLNHADIIWEGTLDENINVPYNEFYNEDECEGYVLRPSCSYPFDNIGNVCAKFVRSGHVQSDTHWKNPPYKFNSRKVK